MSTSYHGDHIDLGFSDFRGPVVGKQTNHYHGPHTVDWPIRVGAIPEQAAHYQHRTIGDELSEALNSFGTVVLRQVLSGTGGVGKTQLAAHHARALARITTPEERMDVLVWANASNRERITFAYAQAAHQMFATVPDDHDDAALLFLTWLDDPNKHQNRRWLIVWDDLVDPAQVRDLWPPHDQPHGRVLVTTRRRDHSLTTQGRHLLDVGVYTPDEAHTFLARALSETGIPHTTRELGAVAHDLGLLPLALGQAVTYMAETGLACADYLELFHDRMTTLHQVFPDWDAPTPLAATWDLSLNQVDTFNPQGVARPLMGLIGLLDGTAIPEHVLTSPTALEYLATQRSAPEHAPSATNSPATPATTPKLSVPEVRTALVGLHRLNLINRTVTTSEASEPVIRTHQIVQRATREHQATQPTRESVYTAANALFEVWPEVERDTVLADHLRSNTRTLRNHSVQGRSVEEWLWEPDGHVVLFQAGNSLAEAGQVGEAKAYWEKMAQTAHHYLGPDHPHTFTTRHNLAYLRGESGDLIGAAQAFEELLPEILRVLGPDHPHALTTRHNLALWRGQAGDSTGAATAYEVLLTNQLRVLGPDHPDTLVTRAHLAYLRGAAGDAAGAAQAFEDLLTDRIRILGPDHPDTLVTRAHLAHRQGEAGVPTTAVTALQDLLVDNLRVLGPDHPDTLATRHNLAWWTYEFGNAAKAVELLTALIRDRTRVLGLDHPDTQDSKRVLQRWQDELPEG
ncbi:tetratricopeptide repeat protein [Nocardiopsis alborubida]|uniref:Tetratricopeptide repeat protein n=1 Tax=Nocardiopsis alborubida TaxID=146802 RepID=A0A7X6RPD1_9ACTN|nr:tetratricopeptide repeat protein [Nocardiopsis alborubida]NKY97046.1 tetratricopeptide repeat protein [Nocardiopsis alborubida]